jgi:hypothetical protein
VKYPTYKVQLPVTRDFIFYGLEFAASKGFICVDEEKLAKQKNVFSDIMGQAASNILSGKSIVGLTLPVRIFEPRSLL